MQLRAPGLPLEGDPGDPWQWLASGRGPRWRLRQGEEDVLSLPSPFYFLNSVPRAHVTKRNEKPNRDEKRRQVTGATFGRALLPAGLGEAEAQL